jgi:predicted DNA-binding transcriptional regulator AlpA
VRQNLQHTSPSVFAPTLGDDLYERPQLAKIFGVTVRTIYRLEQRRLGPPRLMIGRKIFYRRSTVEKWLADREAASGPVFNPSRKPVKYAPRSGSVAPAVARQRNPRRERKAS